MMKMAQQNDSGPVIGKGDILKSASRINDDLGRVGHDLSANGVSTIVRKGSARYRNGSANTMKCNSHQNLPNRTAISSSLNAYSLPVDRPLSITSTKNVTEVVWKRKTYGARLKDF
jgi:hypothetical protein